MKKRIHIPGNRKNAEEPGRPGGKSLTPPGNIQHYQLMADTHLKAQGKEDRTRQFENRKYDLQVKSGKPVLNSNTSAFASVIQCKKPKPKDEDLTATIKPGGFLATTTIANELNKEEAKTVPVAVPAKTEAKGGTVADDESWVNEDDVIIDLGLTAPAVGIDKEKAGKIWEFVNKQYELSFGKGAALHKKLKETITDYQDPEKKTKMVADNKENNDKNILKFERYYETLNPKREDSAFTMTSRGLPPLPTADLSHLGPDEKKEFGELSAEALANKEVNYNNKVDPVRGHIEASYNYNEGDLARYQPGGHLPNSEILWHQYRKAAEILHPSSESGGREKLASAMKNIQEIKRSSIVNEQTLATMYLANNDTSASTAWNDPANEFLALLGTPNARSSVHMLIDHIDELEKTISGINTTGRNMTIGFGAFPAT